MRIILCVLLSIPTIVLGQSFGGNAALNFHLPQGEFKDAGVTTGFGGDFSGMYYVVDQLAFGINGGLSVYDKSYTSTNSFNFPPSTFFLRMASKTF